MGKAQKFILKKNLISSSFSDTCIREQQKIKFPAYSCPFKSSADVVPRIQSYSWILEDTTML